MVLFFIFNESIQLKESLLIFSPHVVKNCPDILRNIVFPCRFIILAVLNSKLLCKCLSVHIVLINLALLYI